VVSHKLEVATSTLNGHVYADCSCGTWRRIWPAANFPGLQEAEAEHESHSERAGAEELRNGFFNALVRQVDSFLIPLSLT
jgi:hypothetical protein